MKANPRAISWNDRAELSGIAAVGHFAVSNDPDQELVSSEERFDGQRHVIGVDIGDVPLRTLLAPMALERTAALGCASPGGILDLGKVGDR